MGLLIFLPVFLFYFLFKFLMVTFLIMLSIYLIVIIAKKRKPGKFILFPIIALCVLQTFTLPIDAPSVYDTGKAVVHRMRIATNDYAVIENAFDDVLEYDGKEYVLLDSDLDAFSIHSFFADVENFNKETTLLFKSDSEVIYKHFFFSGSSFWEKEVYTAKNAPDKDILFIKDYGDTIWCSAEKYDEYKQKYTDASQFNFYIVYTKDGVENRQEISLETFNKIAKCKENYLNDNTKYFSKVKSDSTKVSLMGVSKDSRLILENMGRELVVIDGKLYFCFKTSDGQTLGRKLGVNFN